MQKILKLMTMAFQLTEQQQSVLDNIKKFLDSDSSVFILKGYAGTGKTTMVKQIVDYITNSLHKKAFSWHLQVVLLEYC